MWWLFYVQNKNVYRLSITDCMQQLAFFAQCKIIADCVDDMNTYM